ncbi:MAG: hypothetical protein PHR60_05780 [Eubacteriales bacterium]|nr:hypothetical protein [Eubacteriales bacterium]
MVKKKPSNKFRDKLADYYLTNREITKEDDARYRKERQESKKQPWKKTEKIMLLITLVALVLVLIRYFH